MSSVIGKYVQAMKLGEVKYLRHRIFYHAYSTHLVIQGVGYHISILQEYVWHELGTNWELCQAECASGAVNAWTIATTKA